MQIDDYKAEIRKTLEEWDAKIHDLRTRAEHAGREKQAELMREIEGVIVKKQAIEQKLEQLEQGAVDDWGRFVDGLSHAAKDLQSSLDRAMSK